MLICAKVPEADPFGSARDAIDRRECPAGQEVAASAGEHERHQQAPGAQQTDLIEDRFDFGQ